MLSQPTLSAVRSAEDSATRRDRRDRRRRRGVRHRFFAPTAIAVAAGVGLAGVAGVTAAVPAAAAVTTATTTTAASALPWSTTLISAVSGASLQPATLTEITAAAEESLTAARAAVAGGAAIEAGIRASGLQIDAASTTVDTTELSARVEQLSSLDVLPLLVVSELTDDTVAETRRVSAITAALRDKLDAALAQRAAEQAAAEAAAQAQREAEAAAAAAAALAQANTVEGAQATAAALAASEYGWGSDQFSCLASLWNRESSWNYQAYNASSGATGIPQALPGSKMASAGSDWQTNATTQIIWGLGYISSVYGSPCSAWGHSQATGWY